MLDFQKKYDEYFRHFDAALEKLLGGMDYRPQVLTESMRYSLQSGGKRIRPVLFFAGLDLCGIDYRNECELALALECVHTYSLIHDDLPAMDNDDFRRGRPSNHKAFGEANAILAGDALLTLAFELALSACPKGGGHLEAAQILVASAGAKGMVAGQSADLLYEKQEAGAKELEFIYAKKTGRLIAAPLEMAAAIGGLAKRELSAYGEALGALFQITDDILDVKGDAGAMGKTLGKDQAEGKLTCVRIYGLEKSEKLADIRAQECRDAVCGLQGGDFLAEFAAFVRNRRN